MSYTKEQLVEQLKATLDIITTASESEGWNSRDLHTAFLMGVKQGLESQWHEMTNNLPKTKYIDMYLDNLELKGYVELELDPHDLGHIEYGMDLELTSQQFEDFPKEKVCAMVNEHNYNNDEE